MHVEWLSMRVAGSRGEMQAQTSAGKTSVRRSGFGASSGLLSTRWCSCIGRRIAVGSIEWTSAVPAQTAKRYVKVGHPAAYFIGVLSLLVLVLVLLPLLASRGTAAR